MKVRNVDYALYQQRLEEYDFDVVTIARPTSRCRRRPTRTSCWHKAADEKGINNFRGVKSPVVDQLLDAMDEAQTPRGAPRRRRALDRVVMLGHCQVPELYSGPATACRTGTSSASRRRWPKYYRSTRSAGPTWAEQLPGPSTTWWIKDRVQALSRDETQPC